MGSTKHSWLLSECCKLSHSLHCTFIQISAHLAYICGPQKQSEGGTRNYGESLVGGAFPVHQQWLYGEKLMD